MLYVFKTPNEAKDQEKYRDDGSLSYYKNPEGILMGCYWSDGEEPHDLPFLYEATVEDIRNTLEPNDLETLYRKTLEGTEVLFADVPIGCYVSHERGSGSVEIIGGIKRIETNSGGVVGIPDNEYVRVLKRPNFKAIEESKNEIVEILKGLSDDSRKIVLKALREVKLGEE